jgi:hypothetical protein
MQRLGIDFEECVEPPAKLDTMRQVFERQIRYWQCARCPRSTAASSVPPIPGWLSVLFGPDRRFS